jgi:hypothetical protein
MASSVDLVAIPPYSRQVRRNDQFIGLPRTIALLLDSLTISALIAVVDPLGLDFGAG